MGKDEDVSNAQHSGALRRGEISGDESFTLIKFGDKLFMLPKDLSSSSLLFPSACYYVEY